MEKLVPVYAVLQKKSKSEEPRDGGGGVLGVILYASSPQLRKHLVNVEKKGLPCLRRLKANLIDPLINLSCPAARSIAQDVKARTIIQCCFLISHADIRDTGFNTSSYASMQQGSSRDAANLLRMTGTTTYDMHVCL